MDCSSQLSIDRTTLRVKTQDAVGNCAPSALHPLHFPAGSGLEPEAAECAGKGAHLRDNEMQRAQGGDFSDLPPSGDVRKFTTAVSYT